MTDYLASDVSDLSVLSSTLAVIAGVSVPAFPRLDGYILLENGIFVANSDRAIRFDDVVFGPLLCAIGSRLDGTRDTDVLCRDPPEGITSKTMLFLLKILSYHGFITSGRVLIDFSVLVFCSFRLDNLEKSLRELNIRSHFIFQSAPSNDDLSYAPGKEKHDLVVAIDFLGPWSNAERGIKFAREIGSRVVIAQVGRNSIYIGPMFEEGVTVCFECYVSRRASCEAHPVLFRSLMSGQNIQYEPRPAKNGTTGIAELLLSSEVASIAFSGDVKTSSAMIEFNIREMLIKRHYVLKSPRCRRCCG